MDVLDETVGAIDEDIVVTTTIDRPCRPRRNPRWPARSAAKAGNIGVGQGALVAIDAAGAIRALVGGRDYEDSQFDRVVSAHRQPGSSFKPFVYLTALEHGLTPDTVREDAPINVRGWKPENSSTDISGEVNAHHRAGHVAQHRGGAAGP